MRISLVLIAGIGLFLACAAENGEFDFGKDGVPEAPYGVESSAEGITESDIAQMRAMMVSLGGWQSYFPRALACWDPFAIRLSVYDLASFPRIAYDGTIKDLSSLQLSVIPQGAHEYYYPEEYPEIKKHLSKEAEYIWDSFCADIDRLIENDIRNVIEQGTFWEKYNELSSILERQRKVSVIGSRPLKLNYSLRIIQSIHVTSSTGLFGVKAGEDIGSHFVLSGKIDYLSHEWFAFDGQFERINEPIDGMSIEKFLEYRPHMRQLEIKLKDIPEENLDNLEFTVCITYEDGDEVTASTTIIIE